MKFRWSLAPPQPLLAGQVASVSKLSPLLAQCLLNRGLSDPILIGAFLEPRLKQLSDPFLLPGMAVGVDRLFRARQEQEPLVIFGDYDVDGVTATAVLLETLRPLGWIVDYYLPHRMEEGYGLGKDAVENCLKKFPAARLLLAVDCGSASRESIALIRQRGIDVIVVDHHQVSDPAPDATALINPQLLSAAAAGVAGAGQQKALCSAGLAFKLAHALVKHGRQHGLDGAAEFDLRPLLDLVALGTIADLVPLTGENRILAFAGLDRLRTTQRPGLVALKKVSQTPADMGTYEVGFQLGPRLNAAGRLETAEAALELVLSRDPARALELASALDQRNRERQKIERTMAEEVIGAVQTRFDPERDFAIVEGQKPWHIGVVGIVASRVLQQFYRPTIILGGDGPALRGSGRSIAGFDLAAALRQCDDLLVRHGGHSMAAGISILETNLDSFRARLNELARRALKPEELLARLQLDAEVGLEEITFECVAGLERLKPLGQGNPPVNFFTRNLAHARPLQRVGPEKQHVKMWVTDGVTTHEAVWWGAGNGSLPVGRFELAFTPQVNRYEGQRTIQLKVLDWRAAQT
jgi:single-stranded-DNA-specific exonuclease